jgi:predicted  nucleic acid-binding Zn-ribbon protein
MNMTLNNLVRLEALTRQCGKRNGTPGLRKQIARLRAVLPENILRRFDHLAGHGRLPVAQISVSGACGSCHLALTPGDAQRFQRHAQEPHLDSVLMCPFCGCFLYAATPTVDIIEENETTTVVS